MVSIGNDLQKGDAHGFPDLTLLYGLVGSEILGCERC